MRQGGKLVVTCYHALVSPIIETDDIADAICADASAMTASIFENEMRAHGMSKADRTIFELNKQEVIIDTKYMVRERGLQYTRITQCPRMSDEIVHVEGTLSFKNPYGYLAGELYPLLPFESVVCLPALLSVLALLEILIFAFALSSWQSPTCCLTSSSSC